MYTIQNHAYPTRDCRVRMSHVNGKREDLEIFVPLSGYRLLVSLIRFRSMN